MNYQSKMGFAKQSPFNRNRMNEIQSGQIDMRGTGRELLAFNQGGGQTLQPGQQYNLGNGPTTEMPVETLFQLEPTLVEMHLNTLTKAKQKEFVEKYQPLSDSMKKAALMQMFQMHREELSTQMMQNGGMFTQPLMLPYGEQPSTTQVTQRPLQQLNYGRAFTEFAVPAMNEAQTMGKAGNLEGAERLYDEVLLRNQVRAQNQGNVMRPYQAGGEVPQYNRILPPTEGYRLQSIVSNRPDVSNTTDVVKNPQGMRPVRSSKSKSKPVAQASTPQPVQPMAQLSTTEAVAQVTGVPPVAYAPQTAYGQVPQQVGIPRESSRVDTVPMADMRIGDQGRDYSANSDRFVFISSTPDGQFTNVYDPVSGAKLTRNNKTGLYSPTR